MTVSGARQSIDILEWRMGGFDRRYPWQGANVERQDAAHQSLNKDGVSAEPQPSLRTRHLRVLLLIPKLAPLVPLVHIILGARPERRPGGKKCVSTCRYRVTPIN